MDDQPFGARFVDEMRRLTGSTFGLEYRQVQRLSRMDREEFMVTVGNGLLRSKKLAGSVDPGTVPPEELARVLVGRGPASSLLDDLVNILGGFV